MIKDPESVLDFAVDWASWLQDGETITSASWTIPDGLTQPPAQPASIDGGRTIVWLAGGTVGQTYRASVHITTSAGRQDDRSIEVTVRQR